MVPGSLRERRPLSGLLPGLLFGPPALRVFHGQLWAACGRSSSCLLPALEAAHRTAALPLFLPGAEQDPGAFCPLVVLMAMKEPGSGCTSPRQGSSGGPVPDPVQCPAAAAGGEHRLCHGHHQHSDARGKRDNAAGHRTDSSCFFHPHHHHKEGRRWLSSSCGCWCHSFPQAGCTMALSCSLCHLAEKHCSVVIPPRTRLEMLSGVSCRGDEQGLGWTDLC